MHARLLSLSVALALGSVLILGAPLATEASYLPGETLNPSCLPTDSTCVVTSLTASSTATSFPYYAANGSVLSATSTLTLLTNGNFGIGTTTPWAKLSVTGNSDLGNYALAGYFTATTTATSTFTGGIQVKALNITSSTASSTFANGINLSAGCFAVNNTCVGGSALSGGAANKVAFWTDASTLSNNTNFHWDDSNARLGIGTTSPYAKLSVVGETVSSYFTATSTTATSTFAGAVGIGTTTPNNSFQVYDELKLDTAKQSVYLGHQAGRLDMDNPNGSLTRNTFIGYQVGITSTTSSVNTGLGWTALSSLTTGTHNVGIGATALQFNTTGSNNMALGINTLQLNTTGDGNTAMGLYALASNTTGSNSTAVGREALKNSTSTLNTAVGYQSLVNTTWGSSNTAIGRGSGFTNTTGSNNVAVGDSALNQVSTGGSNTAVGATALLLATTGNNTAVGAQAAYSMTSGNNVTALGFGAGRSLNTGSLNTLVGFQVGYSMTSGSRNILIGNSNLSASKAQVTTGNSNISIGDDVQIASSTLSNQLDIGNLIYGTGLNGTGSTISTGNVGIGTTTPYARLTVWGTDTASTSPFTVANSASTTVFAVYNNGNATYSGLIFQSSDQRLKTNVIPLDASSSLAAILALTPVSYTRLDQPDLGANLGFIAQDVQQIFPDLVSTSSPTALTPDGTLTLNYVGLIAPLVEAFKALAGEVRDLARSITTAVVNATTVNSQQNNTQKLCVGSTCITEPELKAILQNNGQTIISPPAISDAEADSSAIISDNSATSADATTTPQADTTDVATTSTPPTTSTDYSATDTSSPPIDTSSSSVDTSSPPADSPTPSTTISS